jgi:acyl-CoA synthetase (NDP forming)
MYMPVNKKHPLDKMFRPKAIAVIGASASAAETGWIKRLIDSGYQGKIYPINLKAAKINGLKTYSNIGDVPGSIDYAILNVPAQAAPQALRDCVTHGVKFVHCYSAGFSENGSPAGKRLENELKQIIAGSGTRLLGPNCMGIYCPASGLTFSEDFPKAEGRIAVVSQSGAEASRLVLLCQDVNLFFSKVVSYGNAADLDAPELLDYLARDKDTEIIALYIEGVKDAAEFTAAIRKCLAAKPVVVLNAGTTANGARAALAHTASVTWTKDKWHDFFRQTGAIPAATMDEAADILQGLIRFKNIKGKRTAIVGRGGGIGVVATDICERARLIVPQFSRTTQKKLREIRPDAGAAFRNPVEPKLGMEGAAEFYLKELPIIDADTATDIILVQMALDIYAGHAPDLVQTVTESAYALCAAADTIRKPLAVALFSGGHTDTFLAAAAARDILTKSGITVFPGVESAARAISKVSRYRGFQGIKSVPPAAAVPDL